MSGKDEYSKIMNNIREVVVENSFASEIKIIDINTKKGKQLVQKHDIPEVPCLMIGNRYYFRDTLLNKNTMEDALKKNGQR